MQLLNDLRVGNKLSILIVIAVIAVGIVGCVGYFSLKQSSELLTSTYEQRLVPIRLLSENGANARGVSAAVLELMLTTDDKKNQELKNFIAERIKRNNEIMSAIEKLPLDRKTSELLEAVKVSQKANREARTKVLELAMQNRNAEAYSLFVSSLSPLTLKYIDNVEKIIAYYEEQSESTNQMSKEAVDKAVLLMLGVSLLFLIVLGAVGKLISKAITAPLQLMVSVCEGFAQGDFRDKPRSVVRKDEIGRLADTLADMRTSLRLIFKHVNESAEQVAAASEELTASADQSAHAVTAVASSIMEVAQGADKQLGAAENATHVVDEMSSGIQTAAGNSEQMAQQSALAARKAKNGNEAIGKAVSQMSTIEESVNHSAQVVEKLGKRSEEIGQIIETIAGIASQTSLLSLNAAIEAARAGEQGRGFAVVADEVRKLADQSQEAAKKIAELIGEIQQDTKNAVTAMESGTREVQLGANVVKVAGDTFGEIATLVDGVSEQVGDISTSMQRLAVSAQQIVRTVKEIEALSKQTSGEAQSVSAATEEQSASMEEIASASQSLAKLAQELQTEIQKFRT